MVSALGGSAPDQELDMGPLPAPDVVACQFDPGFVPPLGVLRVDWPAIPGASPATWRLPGGVELCGPPPQVFGVELVRWDEDAYAVHLAWDGARFSWSGLRREQVLNTALRTVLAALGTDLAYLLDQPVEQYPRRLVRAA
jgi:hypothetical protein